MKRNWFKELGLEKLAITLDFGQDPISGVWRMGGGGAAAASPSLLPALTSSSLIPATRSALLPAVATKAAPAAASGWLSRLFPKGSGKAGLIGALLPLGLMLGAHLFARRGAQPLPDWAQMYGGLTPPQEM